ncbi:MAG: polymorphic toxin-type HINT domain-containing protein [Planctomycetaceae bacterium]
MRALFFLGGDLSQRGVQAFFKSCARRFRRVERVFRLSAPTMVLTLGGERVETTLEHPFYVEGQGWTPAQDLVTGQRLAGMDGDWTPIDHIEYTRQTKPVFNLRIAADHTYFVGQPDWSFAIWVHNAYSVRQAADGTWEVIDTATGEASVGQAVPDASLRERSRYWLTLALTDRSYIC